MYCGDDEVCVFVYFGGLVVCYGFGFGVEVECIGVVLV